MCQLSGPAVPSVGAHSYGEYGAVRLSAGEEKVKEGVREGMTGGVQLS